MKLSNFCRFSVGLMAFLCASSVMADQAPNPRSAVAVNSAPRTNAKVVTRGNGDNGVVVNRTGAGVARTGRADTVVRSGHKNTVARSAAPVVTTNRSADTAARSAVKAKVSRSATIPGKVNARAATTVPTKSGLARAASLARATAVFNDVSKIGGGYAQCRDSYATCMDQFCANANDTYRRCFCSQRFSDFRDTEAALEEVKVLLQRFEDNNLNAVDKTAAEVNAMYTATVGEAAIKNDVSGAQNTLNEISDLLSGKKKPGQQEKENPMDMSFGFDINMDDLWGSTNSMFDSGNQRTNVADLEGQALYNEVNKQCLEFVTDTCSTDAVLNMATSSYNVMIAQDCNLYEKKIDAQRETVMNTVRQAEKILRQARLEEYRAHNSADVNECLAKVRDAMLQDTACGENYKRCLDYTGNYINSTTGEPIYSAKLFKLTELINLFGSTGTSSDIVGMNPQYSKWLDDRRMFATTALDSCRDIADTVWNEFKRAAIIEINQAQEAKIEEVKASCVATMGECYDTQSGALKSFDKTTAQMSGALAAQTSRAMCAEKVSACAALYGDNDSNQCKFDAYGKLTTPENCGLSQLLDFVGLVDSVKIAEGCADAMTKYTKELCAPASGDSTHVYPWGCRSLDRATLANRLVDQANVYCVQPKTTGLDSKLKTDLLNNIKTVENLAVSISNEISVMLDNECTEMGGIWMPSASNDCEYKEDPDPNNKGKMIVSCDYNIASDELAYDGDVLKKFYTDVTGIAYNKEATGNEKSTIEDYGRCYENSVKTQCEWQDESTGGNGYAKYENGKCVFATEWYEYQCKQIGGYYVDSQCYIAP